VAPPGAPSPGRPPRPPGPRWWRAGLRATSRRPLCGSGTRRGRAGGPGHPPGPRHGVLRPSRPGALAQCSALTDVDADEDTDILSFHLRALFTVSWRASQQTTDPAPTPAKDLNHSAAGPSPYQRIPSPGCRGRLSPPRDRLRTGARHHAHSSRPSPRHLPPGSTNKVTGGAVHTRPVLGARQAAALPRGPGATAPPWAAGPGVSQPGLLSETRPAAQYPRRLPHITSTT